ncbi:MAG: tRNA (cytidine(34)-2'-O)-methyltransferase [Candidatus Dadabacteria bacterium]|nr:MAG: tRNA (cytidine(34)-2'-O)-methyltransferase [Candidatus Dadabacteria bacterium]
MSWSVAGVRIVLLEPEIPQNTGSIARTAAATRTPLDLIGPLGFSLDDRYLKRAGLDYWPLVDWTVYDNWQEYQAASHEGRMLAFSARRGRPYTQCRFRADDRLLFGKETVGLGAELLDRFEPDVYTIPIEEPGVRSLNLATAVGIVLFEARRQLGWLAS